MFSSLEETIERAKQRELVATEALGVLKKLKEEKNNIKVSYTYDDGQLIIAPYKLSDITAIRKMLRLALGEWHDSLEQQFVSSGLLISVWKSEPVHGLKIEIWYECPLDKIDEKLQKDGCKIVERQITEYKYVCEVNGNSK